MHASKLKTSRERRLRQTTAYIEVYMQATKKMRRDVGVSSLTSRCQATVPKDVREFLKLSEREKIVWILEDGKIVVKKA